MKRNQSPTLEALVSCFRQIPQLFSRERNDTFSYDEIIAINFKYPPWSRSKCSTLVETHPDEPHVAPMFEKALDADIVQP